MNNILIYSQVGMLGGSLRLLYNLGLYLSKDRNVTLCLRNCAALVKEKLTGNQNFRLIDEKEFSGQVKFSAALFHLPFGNDGFLDNISSQKSILVVMEIQSKHPLNLSKQDAARFQKVVYLHKEQLPAIQKLFSGSQCHLLPVINNIDFDLPFQKTNKIASVGVWQYKHNLKKIFSILKNTDQHIKFKMFSERPPTLRELGFKIPAYYYLTNISKRFVFSGLEFDAAKLYAGFDCLLHLQAHGNGTSIVVSDALACGKLVVLSSLAAYREAYSKLEGVYFIDDPGNDLNKLIIDFDAKKSSAIKSEYHKHYSRSDVLKQWDNALFS